MTATDPATLPPPPSPAKKWRPGIYTPKAVSQAIEIQRTLMERIRRKETKSSVVAALVRAWCDVEETKRVLRGIPLVKPVDCDPLKLPRMARRTRSVHQILDAPSFRVPETKPEPEPEEQGSKESI